MRPRVGRTRAVARSVPETPATAERGDECFPDRRVERARAQKRDERAARSRGRSSTAPSRRRCARRRAARRPPRASSARPARPRRSTRARPRPRPSSFSTISATKLSLSAFIRWTTFASRCERSKAIGSGSRGSTSLYPARPRDRDAASSSATASAVAAAAAEPFAPANWQRRRRESAESGGDSMPSNYGFQPSASRRESKYVSSPKTRALSRVGSPWRRTCARAGRGPRAERRIAVRRRDRGFRATARPTSPPRRAPPFGTGSSDRAPRAA